MEAESFDRVLLDVPCPGLGTLARHADARWNLKSDGIEELVGLQHQLLEQGARLMKPDGRLVYATCRAQRRTPVWWRRLWRRTPTGSLCQSPCNCGPITKAAMASCGSAGPPA